jgi:hypothetical protein
MRFLLRYKSGCLKETTEQDGKAPGLSRCVLELFEIFQRLFYQWCRSLDEDHCLTNLKTIPSVSPELNGQCRSGACSAKNKCVERPLPLSLVDKYYSTYFSLIAGGSTVLLFHLVRGDHVQGRILPLAIPIDRVRMQEFTLQRS